MESTNKASASPGHLKFKDQQETQTLQLPYAKIVDMKRYIHIAFRIYSVARQPTHLGHRNDIKM